MLDDRPGNYRGWRVASADALYGPAGFYRRVEGPAGHFRTSAHGSRAFAHAVRRLATVVDAQLEHPDEFTVVDVGAGRGELLAALTASGVPDRWRLVAVEVADRPVRLPGRVTWTAELPRSAEGLLIANEWLDVVPVDVVQLTRSGPRYLHVDDSGREQLAGAPRPGDLGWLDTWWPLHEVGARAEVGRPRDDAWASAIGSLRRGVAVAIDYTHVRERRPRAGSLTAYRGGRRVSPVPDGRSDITAHVAVDACAAAGQLAGAGDTLLTTQRRALRSLGLTARRPARELAATAPTRYLDELMVTSDAAELTDAAGLGGFCWLVQSVRTVLPAVLR